MSRPGLTAAAVVAVAVFPLVAETPPPEPAPTALTITYVGSSGFLLEAGGRKVLVDALTEQSFPPYLDVSEELREQLLAARPPFDDVDLVLATHVHGDHFDPVAVGRFLQASPGARFVSTPQAVAKLSSRADYGQLRERVRAVLPEEGKRLWLPDLDVEILHLHHGRGRPTQNVGFLVDLGGWRILHVGDAEAVESLAAYHLEASAIDLAMIPDWYFREPRWPGVVASSIAAQRYVVMHLPPEWWSDDTLRLALAAAQKLDREAIVFHREGDSLELPPQAR